MTANHLWSLRMLAAAGVLAPAGCQILVDLRGNCESDPDCRRDEQCVSNRCVPRDGGAGRLAFAAAPATAAAGECSSPLRLETRDGSDNPLPMSEPTSVQIAATPPDGVAFYTDPGCTSPLTSVILAIGTSEATFHAAISRAGRVTIEASSAGFQSASHGMDVAPGAPARLGFAAASPTVTVGACSPEVSVEILDKFGNPTRAAWPTAVNLATTSARGKFFADASCTVETNAVVVDAGTQQASVRYRDLAIGTPTLTASASELGSARQVIGVVGTGTPTTLVFATPLRTVTAGDCSGVVTVSTQDSLGNATAASSEIAVSLTSTSPDTTFHTDVSCAQSSTGVIIAAGADTANFYFKDTRAGTPTLTASATGLTSATQVEAVNPAAGAKLAFVVQPSDATAGSAISPAVQVAVQDPFGNAVTTSVAGIAVAIGTNPGGGTLGGTTTVTAASGVATFPNLSINRAGADYTLTATSSPLAGATSALFYIRPAAPSKLAFTTQPSSATAGTAIAAVQVTAQDASGNTVTSGTASIIVAIGTNPSGGTLSGTATVTAASGVATFSNLSIDKAGTGYTLTASSGSLTAGTSAPFNMSPAAPSKLVFTTAPQTVTAGNCSAKVTVRSLDPLDNPSSVSSPTTVTLASSPSTVTFYSDVGCTASATTVALQPGATDVSFYFRASAGGVVTITATSAFPSVSQAHTILGTSTTAVHLALLGVPATSTAGNCTPSALRVQMQNEGGQPAAVAADTTVTLNTNSTTGKFTTSSACSVWTTTVSIPAGSTEAPFYFWDTTAGTWEIRATATGLTEAVSTVTVQAQAATRLAFISPQQTVTVTARSDVYSLQTQDTHGNPASPASDLTVSLSNSARVSGQFYTDTDCLTPIPTATVTIPNATNRASFYYSDSQTGAATIAAAASGVTGASQPATIVTTGVPAKLKFALPSPTNSAGACSFVVTVETRDSFGNLRTVGSHTPVNLSTTSSGGSFYLDASCTTTVTAVTIVAGSSTGSFYFRDTRSGTPTLTVSATHVQSL